MTAVMFPELDELEGKLKQRQKSAADFLDEARTTEGALDLRLVKSVPGDSAEKAAWFQNIQEEMGDLAKQAAPLRALKRAAEGTLLGDLDDAVETGDGRSTKDGTKSLGAAMKAAGLLKSGARGEIPDFDVKTLFQTSAGWTPESVRGPRLVDYPQYATNVLDLIPTTTTNAAAIKYMEETTNTNNAAEVAEGAAKPESAFVLTERVIPVSKIATTLPVTDEQFDDEPRAAAFVDNRLRRQVILRLAGQVMVGNGTAPNIAGVLDYTIQTQAKGSDPVPDAVYKAMVKVMTIGEAMPDGYVTNPLDWQDVRLLRTVDGIYIWGSPSEKGPDTIWGLRVALVQQMTENTGVVGDFGGYTELAIRKGITVDTGYVNDQFKLNQKTVRAEMRAAFLLYRPFAMCSVTGI